jgi:hypothetical protein
MTAVLTIVALTLSLLMPSTARAIDILDPYPRLPIGQLCILPIPLPCTPLPTPPHGQHFIVHGVSPWQTATGFLHHPFERVPLVMITAEGALNGKALASLRYADNTIIGWAVLNTSEQVQDIHVTVRYSRPFPLRVRPAPWSEQ